MKCLGGNTKKHVSFSVLMNTTNDNGEKIVYKLKFIDSMRFMNISLANLTDNLSELNRQECKKCHENCKYIKQKVDVLIYRCKECNRKSYKSSNPVNKIFSRIYRFCNNEPIKFTLLLRKGVYPYDYMDCWERFNETVLPDIKEFYNSLYQENITVKDHEHAQNLWNTFNIKNMGNYHDLYVQADTLQLADVFEDFGKVCLNIYRLDPIYFVSVPGLAWQACLKMTKGKIRTINRY